MPMRAMRRLRGLRGSGEVAEPGADQMAMLSLASRMLMISRSFPCLIRELATPHDPMGQHTSSEPEFALERLTGVATEQQDPEFA